jgi:hypothetical protein
VCRQENVINDFELNELYMQCKQNLAAMKRRDNKKGSSAVTTETEPVAEASAADDNADLSGKEKTE